MDDDLVTYRGCTALVETQAALKVRVPTKRGAVDVWIPKAAIHDNSECYKMGTEGTLVIRLGLAERKGLPT